MFGSEVLDVVIGLVFVYLVISLICSAALEFLEAFFKQRARYLKQGLCDLLDDRDGSGLVKQIYNHPLVYSLFTGAYDPKAAHNLPSYIPARNFALAMMDTLGAATPASQQQPPSPDTSGAPANLHAAQALATLAKAGGHDREQTLANIEAWYNSAMDRVSGWYKRTAHFTILALGVVISAAINADSISITNGLATDKALRASLISASQELARQPPSSGGASGAASAAETDSAAGSIPSCRADLNAPDCRFQLNLRQIRNAGLPLGWADARAVTDPRHMPGTTAEWLMKLLGITLTALAVSLGAPFWFDMLNRFVVVRSTIKPHEKSPEEPAKD